MTRSHALILGLTASVALAATAAATAEDETKKVEAGGLSFQVPTDWKVNPPSNQMRLMEIQVGPAEGDEEPAELVVYAFPGGAGTVADERRRAGSSSSSTRTASTRRSRPRTIKAQRGDEVTVVETAGRYVAAVRPGSPERVDKPGYRLLGAILTTPRTGYFLKMVGPDKTVAEAKPAFEALVKSMAVGE